ncbi:MAG: hypothetical protein LBS81_00655 [Endomicrobium sp.]|jgi:hypothetical protein|nr:hypothetical protein [Endomicrobium sp.]
MEKKGGLVVLFLYYIHTGFVSGTSEPDISRQNRFNMHNVTQHERNMPVLAVIG